MRPRIFEARRSTAAQETTDDGGKEAHVVYHWHVSRPPHAANTDLQEAAISFSVLQLCKDSDSRIMRLCDLLLVEGATSGL